MSGPINWRLAGCGGENAHLFFPGKSGGPAASDEALRICHGCPIEAECLTDALAAGDVYAGVRGGKTAEERREMVRGKTGRPAVDHAADIIRLTGKRWPPAAIAARYGIDTNTVYRVLKAHRARERETAA